MNAVEMNRYCMSYPLLLIAIYTISPSLSHTIQQHTIHRHRDRITAAVWGQQQQTSGASQHHQFEPDGDAKGLESGSMLPTGPMMEMNELWLYRVANSFIGSIRVKVLHRIVIGYRFKMSLSLLLLYLFCVIA